VLLVRDEALYHSPFDALSHIVAENGLAPKVDELSRKNCSIQCCECAVVFDHVKFVYEKSVELVSVDSSFVKVAVVGENAVKDETLFETITYKCAGYVIILAVLDSSVAIPSAVSDGAIVAIIFSWTITVSMLPLALEKDGFFLGFGVNLDNSALAMRDEIRDISAIIHVEFFADHEFGREGFE